MNQIFLSFLSHYKHKPRYLGFEVQLVDRNNNSLLFFVDKNAKSCLVVVPNPSESRGPIVFDILGNLNSKNMQFGKVQT